ncbi:MAG: hypothetical protein KTR31_00390 [Myxococcales bacterium]|nr:hypothetical protein [Myxococcales bacterium]
MLVVLMSLADAHAFTCGLPHLARDLAPLRTQPVSSLGGGGDKLLRDAYGVPNLATSENFAVRWGNAGGITEADAQDLLDAFETAWATQLEGLDHSAPYGTGTYRFNVYIGDTGSGAPSAYGAGGYYWVDTEGWPMNVVSLHSMGDPNSLQHVASHEFYHAIQGATARFAYDGIAAWYTEATAEWAAIRTVPDNPFLAPFLFAYGNLPEYPLTYFRYPTHGTVEELYQYGAVVFPLYVADLVGDDVIRDTWEDDGFDADPLEVLRAHLADDGYDLDEIFLDHIAANAVWDYAPYSGQFADNVENFGSHFGLDPVLARYSRDGTGDEIRRARADAPRRYGYNLVQLADPDTGTLTVSVQGSKTGSEGSPAQYGARVVRTYADGSVEYHDVDFVDVTGELVLDDVGAEDEIWLVVGAWTETALDDRWESERFEYDYALTIEAPKEPVDPDPTETDETDETPATPLPEQPTSVACGCSNGGAGTMAWLVPLLLVIRRRR